MGSVLRLALTGRGEERFPRDEMRFSLDKVFQDGVICEKLAPFTTLLAVILATSCVVKGAKGGCRRHHIDVVIRHERIWNNPCI